jgi:hypothetical protein
LKRVHHDDDADDEGEDDPGFHGDDGGDSGDDDPDFILPDTGPSTAFFAELAPYQFSQPCVGGWMLHSCRAVAEAHDTTDGEARVVKQIRDLNEREIAEHLVYLKQHPRLDLSTNMANFPTMLKLVGGGTSNALRVLCVVCDNFSIEKTAPVAITRTSLSNLKYRHLESEQHARSVRVWRGLPEDDADSDATTALCVADVHRQFAVDYLAGFFEDGQIKRGVKSEHPTLEFDAEKGTLKCVDRKCPRTFMGSDEVAKNPYNLSVNITRHLDARNRRLLKEGDDPRASVTPADAFCRLFSLPTPNRKAGGPLSRQVASVRGGSSPQ